MNPILAFIFQHGSKKKPIKILFILMRLSLIKALSISYEIRSTNLFLIGTFLTKNENTVLPHSLIEVKYATIKVFKVDSTYIVNGRKARKPFIKISPNFVVLNFLDQEL